MIECDFEIYLSQIVCVNVTSGMVTVMAHGMEKSERKKCMQMRLYCLFNIYGFYSFNGNLYIYGNDFVHMYAFIINVRRKKKIY